MDTGKKSIRYFQKIKMIMKEISLKVRKVDKGKSIMIWKILIYEGEFENDKRNGYGKEYKDGKIIFEGKYLNGERWEGYGKEFNNEINNDKIGFEGEYKNGKRNGKGKEYFNENIIKFEGNYI